MNIRIISHQEIYEKKFIQEIGAYLFEDFIKGYHINGQFNESEKPALVKILSDPLSERSFDEVFNTTKNHFAESFILRVSYLFGVTDNSARVAEEAIAVALKKEVKISSFREFLFLGGAPDEIQNWSKKNLANPLVEKIEILRASESDKYVFKSPNPSFAKESLALFKVYKILDMSDEELESLNKKNHWAFQLSEIKLIQSHYGSREHKALRLQKGLGENPTDIEIELLAQSWSEHCKHKIFAAHIDYTEGSVDLVPQIGSKKVPGVFKTYIKNLTEELLPQKPWLISVFHDNAGIVRFFDGVDLCIKVETHNSPSALDPYGGALTGVLGVQRDILGTGLGAEPLANMDVFCLSAPDSDFELPEALKSPPVILNGVHRGVADGGNKMGIPTVNGSFYFDPQFAGKPLVFCGTLGVLPPTIQGEPSSLKRCQVGDYVVMAGGRIGKDGIHGATLSSLELNDETPGSMVQLGDPFTQRRLHDFLLAARDQGLFSSVTDNGAGGLSSSVGEMAQATGGVTIDLSLAPLKYQGLQAFEILVSESQERMTFSVPQKSWNAFDQLAKKFQVEVTKLGQFTQTGYFEITYQDQLLCYLDLNFIHQGLKPMELKAHFKSPSALKRWVSLPIAQTINPIQQGFIQTVLPKILGDWNVRSRKSRLELYDQEVKGSTVIRPYEGESQRGAQDAGVLSLHLFGGPKGSGVCLSHGLAPQISEFDTYHGAQFALDEAVRSCIAVGADPNRMAILDNFSWPDPLPGPMNPEAEQKTAELVRACEGLYDLAKCYQTPFVSGKDSMKNDFIGKDKTHKTIKISVLPTVLVTAIGALENIQNAQTTFFKNPGEKIYLLGHLRQGLLGSVYSRYFDLSKTQQTLPRIHSNKNFEIYKKINQAIDKNLFSSLHDVSEGGILTSLCESVFGSKKLGAHIQVPEEFKNHPELLFSEAPGLFVVSFSQNQESALKEIFSSDVFLALGETTNESRLTIDWGNKRQDSFLTDELFNYWSVQW